MSLALKGGFLITGPLRKPLNSITLIDFLEPHFPLMSLNSVNSGKIQMIMNEER